MGRIVHQSATARFISQVLKWVYVVTSLVLSDDVLSVDAGVLGRLELGVVSHRDGGLTSSTAVDVAHTGVIMAVLSLKIHQYTVFLYP